MKNRTSLVLMEQLVMILVFALAAAFCLQAFAGADQISRETGLRDSAVLLAQNTAEALKASAGDTDAAALPDIPDGLHMEITKRASAVPGLGTAEISVFDGETETLLFSLTVGWQEVD